MLNFNVEILYRASQLNLNYTIIHLSYPLFNRIVTKEMQLLFITMKGTFLNLIRPFRETINYNYFFFNYLFDFLPEILGSGKMKNDMFGIIFFCDKIGKIK